MFNKCLEIAHKIRMNKGYQAFAVGAAIIGLHQTITNYNDMHAIENGKPFRNNDDVQITTKEAE